LESIIFENLFKGIYKNKTVLVTGHSGFKGSWLCFWLLKLGAKVVGVSLEENTKPNHFELLNLDMISIYANVIDKNKISEIINEYQPSAIFHLAAQSLVRLSYKEPVNTFETNIMGTINILEAITQNENIAVMLNITSDKCYENKELNEAYKENDSLNGYDPYSASKACSEIVTSSYRNSFFNIKDYGRTHNTLIASCRSGNVIGGADWNEDRILTDIVKSIVNNKELEIRSPKSTRPWQHVLEPLSAYLLLGQKLLEKEKEYAKAWNFGPDADSSINVENLVLNIKKYWTKLDYKIIENKDNLVETKYLRLDCSMAKKELKWNNIWNIDKTLNKTISWYKTFYEDNYINTKKDLEEYIIDAKSKKIEWAND
jgi:CDP-glucose 4,6-dehydratase